MRKSLIDLELERNLLLNGFRYEEISKLLNIPIKTVRTHNSKWHKVDVFLSFRNRIYKEGIPNNCNVSDSFGYWFSGFFDGEGCLGAFKCSRTLNNKSIDERRICLIISIRYDDIKTLEYIFSNLKCGKVSKPKERKNNSKPIVTYRIDKVKDLAEIIIPIFEKYKLHTKKEMEFDIWKIAVIQKYIETLGGSSNKLGSTKDESIFSEVRKSIDNIRHILS